MAVNLHLGIAVQGFVVEAYLANQLTDVATSHRKPPVLRLRLAKLQYVVDQTPQPFGTLLDHGHLPAGVLRQAAVLKQVVDGTEDECQRCAQFVGDICKEPQALLVHLLLLLTLAPLQFEGIAERQLPLVRPHQQRNCC